VDQINQLEMKTIVCHQNKCVWCRQCVIPAGSLGTSVFDPRAVLVGASGGVYALLAGHLANILLVRRR